MRLYEINEAIEALLEAEIYNPETGEIFNGEAFDALKDLEMARDEKLENTALYIKSLTAEVAAIKEEEKKLFERRKAKENKVENIKNFIDGFMNDYQMSKFETARCKLSFRASDVVIVNDMALLPDEFLRRKEVVDPDKTAIKKALKQGIIIEGASLESKKNLQVK